MICESDGILAKPTNDNGKIANGSADCRYDTRLERVQTVPGSGIFIIIAAYYTVVPPACPVSFG
jgi:hypothetical protein